MIASAMSLDFVVALLPAWSFVSRAERWAHSVTPACSEVDSGDRAGWEGRSA
jgi:hypothetical protein